MEIVFEKYGINNGDITGFLRTFDAKITGETALYAYIYDKSPDNVPKWMPKSIDIIIPYSFSDLSIEKQMLHYIHIITEIMKRWQFYINNPDTKYSYIQILTYIKDNNRINITLYNPTVNCISHEFSVYNIQWVPDDKFSFTPRVILQDVDIYRAYLLISFNPKNKTQIETISRLKEIGFSIYIELKL